MVVSPSSAATISLYPIACGAVIPFLKPFLEQMLHFVDQAVFDHLVDTCVDPSAKNIGIDRQPHEHGGNALRQLRKFGALFGVRRTVLEKFEGTSNAPSRRQAEIQSGTFPCRDPQEDAIGLQGLAPAQCDCNDLVQDCRTCSPLGKIVIVYRCAHVKPRTPQSTLLRPRASMSRKQSRAYAWNNAAE